MNLRFNYFVLKISFYLLLVLPILLVSVSAKPPRYVSNATPLTPDEYSFGGFEPDLYLDNSPAFIVLVPKSIPVNTKAQIDLEISKVKEFFPSEPTGRFIYKSLDSGVIEINGYLNRYVIELDKQIEPGVIITDGYSDNVPVFAPYSGEYSFVNELRTYFQVNNKRQFKRYIDKRNRSAVNKDDAEQTRLLNIVLKRVPRSRMPTLTAEQTKRVNEAILGRTNFIQGYTLNEASFSKPFQKLEVRIEEDGSRGNNSIIFRDSEQRRVFSHIKYRLSNDDVYTSYYYHSNGLPKKFREKSIRPGSLISHHSMRHFFWESEFVVNTYEAHYRGSDGRMTHTSGDRLTFDEDYRLIKLEVLKYDLAAGVMSAGSHSTTTTYLDDGSHQLESFRSGKRYSRIHYHYKNKQLDRVEMTDDDDFYILEKHNRNIITSTDREGLEVGRIEKFFNSAEYLIRQESKGSFSGKQTVRYVYD